MLHKAVCQDNLFARLEQLQAELLRAVRLVVGTGLHNKRWSRKQAIQYANRTTAAPEPMISYEVERYMVIPAQALGSKLGMWKIL